MAEFHAKPEKVKTCKPWKTKLEDYPTVGIFDRMTFSSKLTRFVCTMNVLLNPLRLAIFILLAAGLPAGRRA